ncbi:MAG: DUF885 domain-containing protein [Pseudomonadota bacterium]
MPRKPLLLSIAAGAMLAACSGASTGGDNAQASAEPAAATTTQSATEATSESARLNAWFEAQFERRLDRSPMYQTFLGRKTNYDQWDDVSDAYETESHALDVASLAEMRANFEFDKLDDATKLSYRMYEYEVEREDRGFPYRNHWYQISQFFGAHSGVPAFLINQHRVGNVDDAEAYIKRLEGVKTYLGQQQDRAENQYANGVSPPKWAFAQMITTSKNIISGAPFNESDKKSTILEDFEKKINALDVDQAQKDDLMERGVAAMRGSVAEAYRSLIAAFEKQEAAATNDDGAWKLPDGEAYYGVMLQDMTTTKMTAGEIHDLGLAEVARIHEEMNAIKDKVGFEGSLQDFFAYMREDPDGKFTYPNTDEGRETYLKEATALIDTMRGRLDELFLTKPKADLVVKRVEPFRERSAGKAFYQRPAADGSRPGIYYANLYNMADMPIPQMEALAYHEGIPGHHMQLAISQELDGIPTFRKFGRVTAYTEGWGLYSEFIPKEMGFYEDPYSDFGRLAMEIWRAARLVVDTGLHDKKWTRQEAIDYLLENTPNPEGDCIKAIERYIVMPGQATAYKIGMMKMLDLRAKAKDALGAKFDIRKFHDILLKDGPVPLSILEENVDAWIAAEKAA